MIQVIALSLICLQLSGIQVINCQKDEEFPRGHMQPLGSHRDPDPVEERHLHELPTSAEFWNDFILPSKPVVFRGAANKSPGSWLWTDNYLKENYGHLEMRLEGNKEKSGPGYPEGDIGLGRDTLENFINTYHSTKKYIVSELPKPMFHEVGILPFMGCPPLRDNLVEIDVWINGNNASSIMHKDAFNQMNCLFNGTKKWKLIDYKHEDKIYKRYEGDNQIGGYSMVDVKAVNLTKYPKVAEAPWKYTVLNAGDCLFLPGSMYHQVQSHGSHNLAVSLLFKRFQFKTKDRDALELGKCVKNTLDFESLDKFQVDWEYPGTGMMSMGNMELEGYRKMIKGMYTNKGKLSKKRIFRTCESVSSKQDKKTIVQAAKNMYKKIVSMVGSDSFPGDTFFSNKTVVRTVAIDLEPEEPSNSYNFEFSLVQPEEILRLLRVGLKKGNGKGSRQDFIQQYRNHLEGTNKYGNQFLDALIQNNVDHFTLEDVKERGQKALAPYYSHQREPLPDLGSDSDPGDIDRIQNEEYQNRMKAVFEEDDPKMFDRILDNQGDQNNENDQGNQEDQGEEDDQGNQDDQGEEDDQGNQDDQGEEDDQANQGDQGEEDDQGSQEDQGKQNDQEKIQGGKENTQKDEL